VAPNPARAFEDRATPNVELGPGDIPKPCGVEQAAPHMMGARGGASKSGRASISSLYVLAVGEITCDKQHERALMGTSMLLPMPRNATTLAAEVAPPKSACETTLEARPRLVNSFA
jgi:hypothetical protein